MKTINLILIYCVNNWFIAYLDRPVEDDSPVSPHQCWAAATFILDKSTKSTGSAYIFLTGKQGWLQQSGQKLKLCVGDNASTVTTAVNDWAVYR